MSDEGRSNLVARVSDSRISLGYLRTSLQFSE